MEWERIIIGRLSPALANENLSARKKNWGDGGRLLLLETYTEAEGEVEVARGEVEVAPSRTLGHAIVVPGTTTRDPRRARCRSCGIDHRVPGRIGRMVPVRGPLQDISMHVKKAPGVGGILPHVSRLLEITASVMSPVPVIISTGGINIIPP